MENKGATAWSHSHQIVPTRLPLNLQIQIVQSVQWACEVSRGTSLRLQVALITDLRISGPGLNEGELGCTIGVEEGPRNR